MDATDRSRFAELLTLLGETFNEPVSDARAAGYWMALGDLPLAAVQHAAEDVLRSCRFFPKPAELREPAVRAVEAAAFDRQRLLEAPGHFGRAIADAAATVRRQEAADAEAARWEALSPEARASEEEAREAKRQAAAAAEIRRVHALHALWAEQDRARVAHRRRTEVTRPDDPTVQRCPTCRSFRIMPNPTGEHWHCARCGTACEV